MNALVIGMIACGAAAGGLAGRAYVLRCEQQNRLSDMRKALSGGGQITHQFASKGLSATVLRLALTIQQRAGLVSPSGDIALSTGVAGASGSVAGRQGESGGPVLTGRARTCGAASLNYQAHAQERAQGWAGRGLVRLKAGIRERRRYAGLPGLSDEALLRAGGRCAAACALTGAVLGIAVSPSLALVLAAGGAASGVVLPFWALKQESKARVSAAAQELPDMLAVTALGLRSGLNFDRSFRLYPQYFTTAFARECALAAQRWDLGMASREQALADLAGVYDFPLLQQCMRECIQALHMGTSLADNLEETADEARKAYRAQKEEAAAKTPIKMMVPLATMILPAMLLFIMGPVVLELVSGW